jgi:hypothetical protein
MVITHISTTGVDIINAQTFFSLPSLLEATLDAVTQ